MGLKLVLSVEALGPDLGGIGRYTWELAQRLPKHDLLQDVQFYRTGRWIKEPANLLQVPYKTAPGATQPRRLPRLRIKPPNWMLQWQALARCRGRVFHGPNFFLPDCAEIGVATVHDLSVFKYPEAHPLERIRHFERDFFNSIRRASHLITDSEATRAEIIDFLAWPAEKITAVPLGVSSSFLPASLSQIAAILEKYHLDYKNYGLCVSTLEPRKKILNLLQAYERLPLDVRAKYPLVLIGGRGWLSDDLHQKIERLSSQGWLRYLGFVPETELPALYAGAHSFFYPSIYEGFGLPVLEAMASGVPVVASKFTSLPEVTQGAALLVDPEDIDALTEAVHKNISDDDWRRTAHKTGLAVSRNFTWDRCVEKTVDVYRKTIG